MNLLSDVEIEMIIDKRMETISVIRNLIMSQIFMEKHRKESKYFTRNRALPFHSMVLLLIQKSLKSIQLRLTEFVLKMDGSKTVTNSAFCQARLKLSHTAFIELNSKGVVEPYYKDGKFKTYKGLRVLGIDGSQVTLPYEPEIRNEFGTFTIGNEDPNVTGEYAAARVSVLYDVLNNIPVDATISHSKSYEVNLALGHLSHTTASDLLIMDRNYTSFIMLAALIAQNRKFVIRCSKKSFKAANEMFPQNIESQIVTLYPSGKKKKEVKDLDLPSEIKVRLVRVILKTGEVEILVTSLLDEKIYPSSEFKELYYLRWGIEIFYGKIKGRLNLENFTGKSVESVKQDFYSTILISGIETVLVENSKQILAERSEDNQHSQTVNKAVSFNAIKNQVIDLFLKNHDLTIILERLDKIFLTNPVCVIPDRDVPRKKSSPRKLLRYHKYKKKICF